MTALSARVKRTIQHYVFDTEAPSPWRGPVVRRDPNIVRRASMHLTWRCVNEFCRQWTMNGAHERGRCNFCNTERGAA